MTQSSPPRASGSEAVPAGTETSVPAFAAPASEPAHASEPADAAPPAAAALPSPPAADPRARADRRDDTRAFLTFLALRILAGLGVVLVAVSLGFFLLRLVPGADSVQTLIGANGRALTNEQIAAVRADLGLDHSLIVQYGIYLGKLVTGDLGTSYLQRQPVSLILGPQILSTLQLAGTALGFAWILATVSTLLTAGRRRLIETPGRVVEIIAASLPQFWLGLMLLLVFAIGWHWFPVSGGTGFSGIVLPALTLAIPLAGLIGQLTRESFTEALDQPFVLSARARGLSDLSVRFRHALRHALIPALAFSGQSIGWLLGGTLVVEEIFARPGIGRVIFAAVNSRDLPLVLGVVIVVAVGYVLVSIIVDILYRIIDPRIGVNGA
ncbi:ABC transporter permease [Mycetocola tolaasinivorans]|uniref:ABC transporter permease n=1 Tax=Mycetocola tolaasinivorans TaxID=76635 RepID=A0A3L7A470_9MICO|nr:ABC transporter permease [Mycetocola tolaasinivorans]RLP74082.1 ABC transporter permease [Mycetocola tolaasinivorans]